MNISKVSFCITCKNRLHQIRQTLRNNLDDNILHQDYVEFILVDFGSTDGLRDWVMCNFQSELSSGYLNYYYTDELPQWHASIAKNTAHHCASGDILVNLDCDNFTGSWGGNYVMKAFSRYGERCVVHQFSGKVGDGSFGRIAVLKKYFDAIGGYDELFEPMGYQDNDLIKRLTHYGLKLISLPNSSYNQAIANTKEEGIKYTGSEKNYEEMRVANIYSSEKNISEGHFIANNRMFGIRKNLFDHNCKELSSKI